MAIPHYINTEDYLALERQSSVRYEYQRGLVYAMAGGTDNEYVLIAQTRQRSQPCLLLPTDGCLRVAS